MQHLQVTFTRELTEEEKQILRNKFQGCYFNLNETLQNGIRILTQFQNSNITKDVMNFYSRFDCDFEII